MPGNVLATIAADKVLLILSNTDQCFKSILPQFFHNFVMLIKIGRGNIAVEFVLDHLISGIQGCNLYHKMIDRKNIGHFTSIELKTPGQGEIKSDLAVLLFDKAQTVYCDLIDRELGYRYQFIS